MSDDRRANLARIGLWMMALRPDDRVDVLVALAAGMPDRVLAELVAVVGDRVRRGIESGELQGPVADALRDRIPPTSPGPTERQ